MKEKVLFILASVLLTLPVFAVSIHCKSITSPGSNGGDSKTMDLKPTEIRGMADKDLTGCPSALYLDFKIDNRTGLAVARINVSQINSVDKRMCLYTLSRTSENDPFVTLSCEYSSY